MNQCYWSSNLSWLSDNRSDMCEHVEADHSLAHMVGCEDDSFGPLVRNVVCKPCCEQAIEREDAEIEICNDCKKEFRRDQLMSWKWYDFYAAQGDEPLLLCKTCRKLPRHQERIRQDDEDQRQEFDGESDWDQQEDVLTCDYCWTKRPVLPMMQFVWVCNTPACREKLMASRIRHRKIKAEERA